MVKHVNMSHSRYKVDLKRRKKRGKFKVRGRREGTQMISCPKNQRFEMKKARVSLRYEQDVHGIDSELKILSCKL